MGKFEKRKLKLLYKRGEEEYNKNNIREEK